MSEPTTHQDANHDGQASPESCAHIWREYGFDLFCEECDDAFSAVEVIHSKNAEIAQLRERVEVLDADGKRFEWLVSQLGTGTIVGDADPECTAAFENNWSIVRCWREAVDSAMILAAIDAHNESLRLT